MNKTLRARLQAFDSKSVTFDRKIVNLYWDMFHGKDVGAKLQELEQEKGAFVEASGYTGLVDCDHAGLNSKDAREMALRRNALLVGTAKSRASEMLQKAGEAQYVFRVNVDGKDLGEGEVGTILNTSEDRSLREKVWRAQEQSLALGPVKLELIHTLNHASKALTGGSFVQLVLQTQDANPAHLISLVDGLEKKTHDAAKSFLEEVNSSSGCKKLEPWDVPFHINRYLAGIKGDAIAKDPDVAMGLLKRTLAALGFNKVHGKRYVDPQDIDKNPFTYSIGGGEGWLPEECAMSIAPGVADYRVFINPELSPSGIDFTRTVLLESGRVLHYDGMNRQNSRRIFKWDNDCMRHALAMLFDSMMEDEKWLHDIAGLGGREAAELSGLLRMKKMMMARSLAAHALFESYIYNDQHPEIAFRAVQEYFAVEPLEHEVEKRWAWHPHLAYNPGGQLSYALGYCISGLIADDLHARFGSVVDRRVAEYLVDNFYTGYEMPWAQRLERATGKRLSTGPG